MQQRERRRALLITHRLLAAASRC